MNQLPPLKPVVVLSLLSITKSVHALMTLQLAEVGLFRGQDEMLMALAPGNPLNVSVLSNKLRVRASTISKMADRLIAKDFIRRATDKKDARLTLIEITPAGIEMQTKIRQSWNDLEASLMPDLDPTHLAELDRVRSILSHRLDRIR